LLGLQVDFVGSVTTRNSLQVRAQNGVELLNVDVGLLQLSEHLYHVLRLFEDLLEVLEVPPPDGLLPLDIALGLLELLDPAVEHVAALLDLLNRVVRVLLVEDFRDLDLTAHLVADLVRNTRQDLLEVGLVVSQTDVAGNGPDQLETG